MKFTKFELENRYDKLVIKNTDGVVLDELTGTLPDDYMTDAYETDHIILEFTSDYSVTKYGFDLEAYQSTDWMPPAQEEGPFAYVGYGVLAR